MAGRVMVVDGDTLRLEGAVVRLEGVAAPAFGTACLPVRHGAQHDDGAAAAAARLANLVRGQKVFCEVIGRGQGRPAKRAL